jgi:siderophore synthetase component
MIHKNSLTAWADLQKRGGLELKGRDEGFEEELKNRLGPAAASLEEALRSATTDDLVRAFFDVLQPFVAMFRGILEFFEKAGAAEGREQWNVARLMMLTSVSNIFDVS